MALLYQQKKRVKNPPHFSKQASFFEAEILELDYQGLGVAKVKGKTWFVENALPNELVQAQILEDKRQYGKAVTRKILRPAKERLTPKCAYYEQCGGCQSQHIPIKMQREAKQQSLFQRLYKLQPKGITLMPMISGDEWQYRRRIRLSLVWAVADKTLKMGFRRKQSEQIIPIACCEVAVDEINALLPKLQKLLSQFSQPQNLGHIELVVADNGVAMLLRYRQDLKENDRTLLKNFAEKLNINLFLQDDKQIFQLRGETPYYCIGDLRLQFDIRDFIQVNAELNLQMVATALDWLELNKQDNVLDLFCGMGNFTLPLSRYVKSAVGIEGVLPMVEKAKANAARNGCQNVEFFRADLSQSFGDQPWAKEVFNKILLDPPRAGADFALNALCDLQAEKMLYVSCNPATLIRDAEILLNAGYRIDKVAMIDMFSHTGHLESMTLFVR